jgi:hypothetical protein
MNSAVPSAAASDVTLRSVGASRRATCLRAPCLRPARATPWARGRISRRPARTRRRRPLYLVANADREDARIVRVLATHFNDLHRRRRHGPRQRPTPPPQRSLAPCSTLRRRSAQTPARRLSARAAPLARAPRRHLARAADGDATPKDGLERIEELGAAEIGAHRRTVRLRARQRVLDKKRGFNRPTNRPVDQPIDRPHRTAPAPAPTCVYACDASRNSCCELEPNLTMLK